MPEPPPKAKKRVVNVKQKRIQIDDDDGWTHIARSGGGSRTGKNRSKNNKTPPFHDQLRPAETPGYLTFHGLEEQFQLYKRRWEESQCHDTVRRGLERALLLGRNSESGKKRRIEKCVCIGLGSLSGFLRGGMVDRRGISLYQLAGLVSMLEWICMFEHFPHISIPTRFEYI